MNSVNWNNLGLKKNPFKIVPSKERGQLVWAGFRENKQKFEKILSDSIQTDDSKVALIVSRYGGGKTHSSFYFANTENLPESLSQYPTPTQLMVKTPQAGSYASEELFKSIIEQIKWRNIERAVRLMREHEGDDSLSILEDWVESEDLAKILWLMGEESDDIRFKAQQALFGQKTATIKNALRIRRTISSNTDMANVLSAIFQLTSKYRDEESINNNCRVILWIDELESLIYYTSKQYRPFTQFIREIFDQSQTNLTLFLSFSFSDPSDFQSIEIVLGQALVDRISNQVVFDEASVEQSKEYLLELLKFYRIENYSGNPFSPFSETAIDYLLVRAFELTEKPRTPRTINKWCLRVINEALSQEVLYNSIIEENFIESINFVDD